MKIRNLAMERSAPIYARDHIVADGIRTVLHAMPSLHLAGESFTPAEAAALIESRIEAARALDAALFEWGARGQAYLEIDDRVEPAMEDLRKLAPAAGRGTCCRTSRPPPTTRCSSSSTSSSQRLSPGTAGPSGRSRSGSGRRC